MPDTSRPVLSFEQKLEIFRSYDDLVEKRISNNRINFEYKRSRQRRKELASQLSTRGNGYVNGRGLENEYSVDPRGWINIKHFSEEELRILIEKAMKEMEKNHNSEGEPMLSLRELLLKIMNEYNDATTERFAEHPLGTLVRNDIPEKIYEVAKIDSDNYVVKASVGQGNWAKVPWIAVMNREITTTTQEGYYLVYLFREDMSKVYLTLAQGVTKTDRDEMERLNQDIREKLKIDEPQIHKNNNYFLGESDKAKKYQESTALFIEYHKDNMPSDEQLVTDLMKMVGYYEQYIKMQKEKETNDIFERYLKEFIESRSSKDQIKFLFSNLRDRLHLINDGGKIDRQNLEYDIDQLLCDLPFVETDKSDHQLKLFTTLDLPRPTYSNMMQMLKDLLNGKYKASDIQKVFKEEKLQTLYKRSRQGLRLLQYLDDKNELTIDTFPSKYEQRSRVKELAVFKMVLQVLNHTNKLSLEERKELLKHVLKMTVISSTTETPIKDSVRDYRLNNVIGWLKALDIIDDNLKIKHEDVGEDANTSRRNDEIHEPFYKFENETDLITHIHSYIQSQGFYYKKEDLKNFYLSLKTKPFVILSGISGTGKSKIVEKFANSVGATRKNGRFRLIPVRPDWSDGSDLIGYVDIKGEFQPGPLTKVLEQAMNDPGHPYFILLDEMNLARVEYYFSDLLSVMESREWDNGQIVTSTVIEREDLESPIIIPENVYVAGTVNMDETTHPFSPKVLDRANTIEFNDVELMNFDFGGSYQVEPVTLHNDRMRSKFLTIKDALRDHEDIVKATTEKLVEINRILEKNNKHFGYRVRDEICFYMIYNDQAQLMSEDEAFDYQLMQKILPKLSGNDHHTADIIHELFVYCTGHEMDLDNVDERIQHAKYPKSARKLTNMYQHQVHNGFTSFWL